MTTEKAKVSRNKSDKTVVAERNYGLKGGEAALQNQLMQQ
jgi:hypothetical protein